MGLWVRRALDGTCGVQLLASHVLFQQRSDGEEGRPQNERK